MNRDRVPTQVIGLPSPTDDAAGLSKIKATAMLLKQKVAGSRGNLDIKAMIMAREDPTMSCPRTLPGNTTATPAPAPAPQKRDARAGMTRVQLSNPQQQQQPQQAFPQGHSLQSPTHQVSSSEASISTRDRSSYGSSNSSNNNNGNSGGNVDLGKRSSRRRNVSEALVPSQFIDPTGTPSSAPLYMQTFEDPSLLMTPGLPSTKTTTAASPAPYAATPNTHNTNTTRNIQQHGGETGGAIDLSTSAPSGKGSAAVPAPILTQFDTMQGRDDASKRTSLEKTRATPSSSSSSPSSTTPRAQPTAAKAFLSAEEQRPPMSPRRHTTSSTSSPPPFSSHHQPTRQVNPTLRQLQTPNIPTNLVQARIMQQEEQKRRDEELAKIPITANLRSVKKIQAVLVDEEEEGDGTLEKSSGTTPSDSSFLTVPSRRPSRPRSKTASLSSVPVSILVGTKQRGDRNHVEPVMIPKKLAEQVEGILGRKLAGKGCVLDEREQEEARRAAEPLPPIVRGQPRKRAVTSSHIRNLVSGWDHKVEEAKEITSEAEQIRLFLEQRSSAHAELPKHPKVPLTTAEILKQLPSLPAPPPTESGTGKTLRPAAGRTRATTASGGGSSERSYGHGSSSSSSSTSSVQEGLRNAPAAVRQDSDVNTKTDADTLSIPMPTESEAKRSGKLLDNTAHLSRPRRKGVRRPSAA
ncbi:hypothetical protein BGX31_004898 [Mortierella sp. GBA43]|nr:hypothetical protein BGX31_004898 [Mortierella sp. GBA43]